MAAASAMASTDHRLNKTAQVVAAAVANRQHHEDHGLRRSGAQRRSDAGADHATGGDCRGQPDEGDLVRHMAEPPAGVRRMNARKKIMKP